MSLKLGTLNAATIKVPGGGGDSTYKALNAIRLLAANASRKRVTLWTTDTTGVGTAGILIAQDPTVFQNIFAIAGPEYPGYRLVPNVPNVFEYQGEIWAVAISNTDNTAWVSIAEECE